MLEKNGISEGRYNELKWLARQYGELKRAEQQFRRGEFDREGRRDGAWNGRPDPTASEGMRLASSPYAWKIAAIEQSAIAAAPDLARWILRNVTEGVRFELLGIPCSRNTFFAARRKFFIELNSRIP